MTRLVSPSRCWSLPVVVLAVLLHTAGDAAAQRDLPGRNTPGVLAAFRAVVARPSESVVRVLCDDKEAALGAVVAADGWIVTKGSLLKGRISCKVKDGRSFAARITGIEETHDLAMLKIEAADLKPIDWRPSQSAEVGNWLATPVPADLPAAIGVVSVAVRSPGGRDVSRRAPAPNSGYLGVGLDLGENGVAVIAMVERGGAADKAGLKVGDVVLTVAGRKVPSPDRLVATIQNFKPGQVVQLRVKRGESEVDLRAILGKRPTGTINRGDMMNMMGSTLSERRGGFPTILQHDTVIKPTDCGGPIVDLDGKAVGINIARAGRTESYAIPSEAVQGLLTDLRSGKLAPKAETEESRIAELERTLDSTKTEISRLESALPKAPAEEKRGLEKQLSEQRRKQIETQDALNHARTDRTK